MAISLGPRLTAPRPRRARLLPTDEVYFLLRLKTFALPLHIGPTGDFLKRRLPKFLGYFEVVLGGTGGP